MHSLRYEDLVRQPQDELARLHAFLGLEHEAPRALSSTQLRGRMGDHAGTARYHDVSESSLERWRTTMGSPLRRRWCRRYLAWLGPARLAAMGYDAELVSAELERLPARGERLASDVVRIAHGHAYTSVRRRVAHGRRRRLGGEPV